MLNLETPKIDSLRIHIPFDEVTVTGKTSFLDNMRLVSIDTGNVESEHIQTTHFVKNNGIAGSYAKVGLMDGKTKVQKPVLVIGFSAKLLQEEYFQGISRHTISRVYQYLMDEGVVTFSFESFLKARVVDTDICQDYLLQGVECKDVFSLAKQLSNHKHNVPNLFSQSKNRGIEWGNRNSVGRGYITKQYLKYYAKLLELKYNDKSTEFYHNYIKEPLLKSGIDVRIDNLLRVETTIKNNEHWETYGVQVKTLESLLLLDLTKYKDVFNRPIAKNMTGEKGVRVKKNYTYFENVQLELIQTYINTSGVPYHKAIQMILDKCTKNKTDRSTKKKKLTELYNGYQGTKGMRKSNVIETAKKYNFIPSVELQ